MATSNLPTGKYHRPTPDQSHFLDLEEGADRLIGDFGVTDEDREPCPGMRSLDSCMAMEPRGCPFRNTIEAYRSRFTSLLDMPKW